MTAQPQANDFQSLDSYEHIIVGNVQADPCRQLYRHVVMQLFKDLLGYVAAHGGIVEKAKTEARMYFKHPAYQEDFQEICNLAGFEYEPVREAGLKIIDGLEAGGEIPKNDIAKAILLLKAQGQRNTT